MRSNRIASLIAKAVGISLALGLLVTSPASADSYSTGYGTAKEAATCTIKVTATNGWRFVSPGATAIWAANQCAKGKNHATVATAEAKKLFPTSLHNGKGDAFRHCYWNARMTIDLGSKIAEVIATNHEDAAPGPAKERKMDLANNATGRKVGANSNGSYVTARNVCSSKATFGGLVTL